MFRTRNAGLSWEPLASGLPQKGADQTVLRDALTADPLDPVGVDFGTRSGQILRLDRRRQDVEARAHRAAVRGLREGGRSGRASRRCDAQAGQTEAEGGAQAIASAPEAVVAITVQVSSALRALTGGRDRIEVGGTPGTLGDALEALWVVYPGLRDRVVTEQREIREHVNVFVGVENVRYTGGLATPIDAGAEISIFQAVSGGSV